jgi:hypothetical protein
MHMINKCVDNIYRGFVRGAEVQVIRGFLGAGTQLPTYEILKDKFMAHGYQSNVQLHAVCSAISAGIELLYIYCIYIIL